MIDNIKKYEENKQNFYLFDKFVRSEKFNLEFIDNVKKYNSLLFTDPKIVQEKDSVLQFDLKSIREFNIQEFVKNYKNIISSDYSKRESITAIFLFISFKYLNNSQQNLEEINILFNELNSLQLINEMNKNPFYWSHRHRIFTYNIPSNFVNLWNAKEKYMENYSIENLFQKFNSNLNLKIDEVGELYFSNELSFIHNIEFLIFLQNESTDDNLKLKITILLIDFIISYFSWNNNLKVKF